LEGRPQTLERGDNGPFVGRRTPPEVKNAEEEKGKTEKP